MWPRSSRLLACALVLLSCSCLCWAWSDASYRAAVLEFMPKVANSFHVTTDQARAVMLENVDSYEAYIIKAKADNVDIMVFPEYGLYGPNFPNRDSVLPYLEMIPNAGANPCDESEWYPYLNITTRLSCLAKKYEMTLAVDMGDVQYCTKWDSECPADRRYQFNTLVVFGADGAIISKYHKTNLYFEPEFDVPVAQYPAVFELFGVKFGMIICFDVMFAKPQVELLSREGVTDLIFSSWWVNTPPILTATQVQQGWSRAFNANMLASNSGFNARVSGSGIFSQGRALASFTNPTMTSRNRLLIADVPKISKRAENLDFERLPNAVRIPKEQLSIAGKPLLLNTKALRTWQVAGETLKDQISVDGLTCSFTYQVASDEHDEHSNGTVLFLYAASGYLTPLFPALACGVATCRNNDAKQCITLLQIPKASMSANQTTFHFFDITATYASSDKLTVYPVSAKNNAALYTDSEIEYKRNAENTQHTLVTPGEPSTTSPVSLLHVGFLGRNLETSM